MGKAEAFIDLLKLLGKSAKTVEPKIMDMFTMPRAKAVTKRQIARLRPWDYMEKKSNPLASQGLTDTSRGTGIDVLKGVDIHNIHLIPDTPEAVALRQMGYDAAYNALLNKNLGHLRNQTRLGIYQLPLSAYALNDLRNKYL